MYLFFIYPSSYSEVTSWLSCMNSAKINMAVQLSLGCTSFISCVCIPRSGIAGLLVCSIFNVFEEPHKLSKMTVRIHFLKRFKADVLDWELYFLF